MAGIFVFKLLVVFSHHPLRTQCTQRQIRQWSAGGRQCRNAKKMMARIKAWARESSVGQSAADAVVVSVCTSFTCRQAGTQQRDRRANDKPIELREEGGRSARWMNSVGLRWQTATYHKKNSSSRPLKMLDNRLIILSEFFGHFLGFEN